MKRKSDMKLLYRFSGVGAIFFPVGRAEECGTCDFATRRCLVECAAFKFSTKKTKIPFENKRSLYNFITTESIDSVILQIQKEMVSLNTKILYWFASGDCPKKHTNRISELIDTLSKYDVIQQGFTRNKQLWANVRKFNNVHMILTVEDRRDIEAIWATEEENVYAMPNFETGDVRIFKYNWNVESTMGKCSVIQQPPGFRVENVLRSKSCKTCYSKKIGCYS